MQVRNERKEDIHGIHRVNKSAFETDAEARLVDILRDQAHPTISLVAENSGEIAGHIMFSPVTLDGHPELNIMGLAPMAVLQEYQGKGIGTGLVKAGLEECKRLGVGAVVVLGYPDYYSRFGFVPASRYQIRCEFDVPDDVFMVMELQEGYLGGVTGTIKYHVAFSSL